MHTFEIRKDLNKNNICMYRSNYESDRRRITVEMNNEIK